MLVSRAWHRCALPSLALLTACGGGGGGGSGGATPPPPVVPAAMYAVGGVVTGMGGGELVLTLNGAQQLTVRGDGEFTFAQKLADGASYTVAIQAQPVMPAQTCVIKSESAQGQVSGTDARRATIQCAVNHYAVGGAVEGLKGQGLTLQLNAATKLPLAADGSFRFPELLPSGSSYQIQVVAQPQSPAQTCSIGGGFGSGTVASQDVADLQVRCSTNHYAVTAQVEGLAGSGLVLRNNGADDIGVVANGPAAFPAPVSADAGYAVTVQRQPTSPSQTCSVVNGVGTSGPTSANVDTVKVVCATRSFVVGGQVAGLQGSGLVLRNNGGDDAVPDGAGRFQFRSPVASGGRYAVTVRTQPVNPSQTCTVNAGTEGGLVLDVDVGGVAVSCATNAYKVGGHVRGLWSASLALQLNGAEDLEARADGAFEFSRALASGSAYRIAVTAQPRRPMLNCDVVDASGLVSSGDITSAVVRCTPVGGTIAYDLTSHPSYGGGLWLYDVDIATGIATRATGTDAFGAGTAYGSLSVAFSANGLQAFVAGSSATWPYYAGAIDTLRLDVQTGRMSRIATESVDVDGPTGVIAHPSGQYVYTLSRSGKIRVYKVDADTGKLMQAGETQSTLWRGYDGFVDSAGRFLYVKSGDGYINVLRINPTNGALSLVQDINVLGGPPSMVMRQHPSGRFIFVMRGGAPGRDQERGAIVTLAVDAQTGMLTSAGTTNDMGINAQQFTLHPSGQFLYVQSGGHFYKGDTSPMVSGSVTPLAIDTATGRLSRLQPDIDNGFPGGSCVAVDVTGRYLYADAALPDGVSSTMRVFRVDPATGRLNLERQLPAGTPCLRYRESG